MKRIKKNKSLWLLAGLLSLVAIMNLAFKTKEPLAELRKDWVQNTDALRSEIEELYTLAGNFSGKPAEVETLKQQIDEVRLRYKRFEFLYAYFYPTHVKAKINGAPLLHLDPFFPRPVVLAPKGMQRLDELIYSDELSEAGEELQQLAEHLMKDLRPIYENVPQHPLEQRETLEAIRQQLVRIFTLGLTGFDTPGSLNALSEARVSLQQLQRTTALLAGPLPEDKQHIAEACKTLFDEGIAYLQAHPGFDRFDRLHYLKNYINPLYARLLELHLALHIETINEVSTLENPVNYFSTDLFSKDFLNPYYYSNLTRAQDSPSLKKLGEKLFYDNRLSKTGQMSCATCHKPELAFADGIKTSVASNGRDSLERNAPTLINAVFSKRFFADMRAHRFDDQMEHVVTNHKEFGTSYLAILKKLKADAEYQKSFAEAFAQETEKITQNNFNLALNAYLLSLRSFNSPFDQYVRGERSALAADAKAGFNLFMGKAACGTCHFAPTFAGLVPPDFNESESEVLGVLVKPGRKDLGVDPDRGRAANKIPKETGVYFYEKSFKTTSVRNVALTAPYFHNGAYNTLEEVVAFYNHGGAAGIGLDLPHQTLPADSLHLSEEEQQQLIAFMQSLTDRDFMSKAPAY